MKEVWQRECLKKGEIDLDDRLRGEEYQDNENYESVELVPDPTNAHRLEAAWDAIGRNGLVTEDNPNDHDKVPIIQLVEYVQRGYYPPPHVMLDIADAFERYMASCGEQTLDEVLLERPSNLTNRPAYQKRKLKYFQRFAFTIAVEPAIAKEEGRKARSKAKLAEAFINDIQAGDEERSSNDKPIIDRKGTFLRV